VRKLLLFLLVLATACSKGAQADAPAISGARSLAAEWALINQQASERKLTSTYVDTMRASIREELQETAKSLTQPSSDYAAEIQALLKLPDDAPPPALRSHAAKLKQIEDRLESA
jgi:predicted subunit of tRNA(5-methylaminomethyl-2-thiouridylate) methyltransferase